MITIAFIVMAYLDRKYPDTYPILAALFLLLSPVLMVAERLT